MSRTPKLHLTPKKQALLRQLMQRQGLARSSAPRIPARDDRSRAPLSYAQRGVWLIHELEPEAAAYNDHFAFRLRGRVNVAALQQGLQAVVERHETLRTTFKTIDEQPTQIISPRLRAAIRLIDADGLGGSVAQKLSMVLASAEARRAFDLEAGPLWQMALVRLSGEDSLLVFTIHHLVSDGWSHGVLLAELTVLYEAFGGGLPAALPGLAIQYGDFALWQKEWVEKSVLAEQLPYWKAKLAGSRPALDLPLDHPRPAAQSFNGARQPLVLTAELERQLRGLSQQFASTLFMVLATAFKALLYRYTGERDILIGTPVAGRASVETESLIGFFVNMVALRTEVSGTLTFVELHERVRETALAAFAHQDLPFERLVEELNPNRGLSRNPLFQAVFSFQNEPPRDLSLGGLSLRRLDIDAGTAKFDLILAIGDSGERLSGSLEYSTDLFDAATIRRATGHLLNLLNGIVSRPAARLCDLPLLAAAESHQIEIEWNATTAFYEDSCSIHHLFEEQVGRGGEAIAIIYQQEHLTYATLNQCADHLASRLRRLTSGPEPRVGVCLRRRPAMVVALLGVLKAGGAYVPMEPSLPGERLRLMARDAAAEVVVSEGEWAAVFGGRSEVIEADGSWMTAAAGEVDTGEAGQATEAVEEVRQTAGPQSLLYVIYTSGSSGRPKGVEVSHGGMLNLVRWHQTAFGVRASDRASQVAGLGFDACGWELWPYLTAGAAVEVVPDEVRLSGEAMRQWLVRRAITISFLPTPLAEGVLAGGWASGAGLRVLLTGGDQLKGRGVVGQGFALVNNYGPTEDSVVATSGVVEAAEGERRAPGIGRPIANTEVYVVDGQGQALGVGVAGELYIGGAGLARGYAGSAGQTAEKFVPDGLSGRAGGRLYRSGDVVRWSGDGRLEFNGRRDEQVKVRGYRIEMGEIEAVMMGHGEVRQCAVRVWEGAEGEKRLVCYVVGSGAGAVEGAELREYLRGKLPDYMVPSAFIELEQLPLTSNGKLDRRALPKPELNGRQRQGPRTELEELLCAAWSEVLGGIEVGVDESFFELGGHSLLAARLVSRVREVLGVEIPLRALFEHPMVSEIAEMLERGNCSAEESRTRAIGRASRDGEVPLSFAQQRLWFLDQLQPGSGAYIISCRVKLSGRPEVEAVHASLHEIVRRHEALRTRFVARDGKPVQQIDAAFVLGISLADLSGLAAAEREQTVCELAREEASRGFDLASGPLIRLKLLRHRDDDHDLIIAMHHIVSDGGSSQIMMREFAALYEAFRTGHPSPLQELEIQYADYAIWQRRWLNDDRLHEQLEYWKSHLAGVPVLELATDYPRSPLATYRAANETLSLSAELTRRLREKSRREGVTMFMALLAGFQVLLARYSGQEDIAVGTPIAGNQRSETAGLIGFFVNTLVMRLDLSGNPTVVELLKQARETALAAFAHQDLPFERLVDETRLERGSDALPLVQVMLAFQSIPEEPRMLHGLKMTLTPTPGATTKVEMALMLSEHQGEIRGWLEYDADLYERERILRMIGHWQRLLEALTADGERRVMDLPLLTPAQWQQVLVEWNETAAACPAQQCVHRLFEEQVGRGGEAIAIIYQQEHLTYATLNQCADHLASRLRRLTSGPEPRVGVCLRRRPAMVVALLGVLKAGGAYVPMEPSLPGERLRLMARDAATEVVISEGEWAAVFGGRSQVIEADGSWMGEVDTGEAGQATEAVEEVRQTAGPQSLLYVIYTSGSSGRPKGVEVSHGGMLNLVRWHQTAFAVSASDRASQVAGLGFDACGWELWPYLTAGAAVEVVPDEVRLSGEAMRQWLVRRAITISFLPTPLAEGVLAGGWAGGAGLRVLLTGGDQLKGRGVVGQGFALVNNYGPTEDSVVATSGVVEAAEGERRAPGIGRPIANTEVYVVDGQGQALGVGVAGELYIGGAGLARGYAGSAGQTAEKFVPDGLSGRAGGRLYRSGDVVRWSGDGRLEFNGRRDEQVKVRGYRIEMGEIEAVMMGHGEVRQCAVRVWEGAEGEKRLVCYVVGSGEVAVAGVELREYLRGKLPDYMVPSAFVALKEMPLTANGKLDRKRLPEPLIEATDAGRPHTAIEEILTGIYAEVLRREPVRVSESFFELGGHSLLATQVVSRIREVLQVDLPLRELFEHPTVAELAAVIEGERGSGRSAAAPPIVRVSRDVELPLSYAQQRLWFVQQLDPTSAAYNIASAVRLLGRLCPHALQQSLGELARRHDILRTRLATSDGRPVPLIEQPQPQPLPLWDLSRLRPADRQQQARALAAAEGARLFDLEQGPVWRAALVGCGEREQELLLTLHHVAGDGWSMGVMVKEVAWLYGSNREGVESGLEELGVQYVDYAAWQREWLSGEVLEEQLGYWRRQLSGLAGLDLPTDRPRPVRLSHDGASLPFQLPAELTGQLRAFSRREGVTLFMSLLAALQALLGRYSGQQDFAVGTPVGNRQRLESEALIGFFVNQLVLRSDLSGRPSFRQLVQRARQTALDAYAHQDLPFEKLVEELQPGRDLYRSPFFQVMLATEPFSVESIELPDLHVSLLPVEVAAVKFDLTLYVVETPTELKALLNYNRGLFDGPTIQRIARHFRVLVKAVIADPDQCLSTLTLLNEAEQQQILRQWNETAAEYPHEACIHQLFEHRAARNPEAIALVLGQEQLSYGELNRQANRLAHRLRGLGVGPEVFVGLCLERSLDAFIGMLAALKAGGAYVPLDPAYPKERLGFILADTRAPVLITTRALAERLPGNAATPVCVDSDRGITGGPEDSNPASGVTAANLAYVIYTSGSTGKPKGVLIRHQSVVNHCVDIAMRFGFRAADRALQFHSISFDAAVEDLFPCLLSGARIVVRPDAVVAPDADLLRLIERESLTLLNLPTAYWHEWVNELTALKATLPGSLRLLIVGGEKASPERFAAWLRAGGGGLRWINTYGPTETTVTATLHEPLICLQAGDAPGNLPIGRPISNAQLFVLDSGLEPVPLGTAGELHIGGDGLARGYLDRPERTAEKFIPNPFGHQSGARLYKTGDRVRYLPDGNVNFEGRLDQQVKIRGFRVETGEVESALNQHAAVRDCVVVAREDIPGNPQLVAYVVVYERLSAAAPELRDFLKQSLPGYMIPSAFITLTALPLTPSGKVNRRALPAPDQLQPEAAGAKPGPRNDLEQLLAELWQSVLGVERVGIHDNFFESGGNSIKAAIFINRLQARLEEFVYVVALFDAPTVASLAAYLEQRYPEAAARVCGRRPAAGRKDAAEPIDARKVAEIRERIRPLPTPQNGRSAEEAKNPSAIFILCPPRSGSTLLRVMLAGHPGLFAPPELELLSFNTLAERAAAFAGRYNFWLEGTIRALMQIKGCDAEAARAAMQKCEQEKLTTKAFYRLMQEAIGGRRLVDKTVSYALDLEILKRAEADFEDARFIHLLRHPSGMIRSFEKTNLDQVFFRYRHDFSARELAELIWFVSHENILEFLKTIPDHRQHRVRFEDMVSQPETALEGICQFLGLEFHPEMMQPYRDKQSRMTDGIHPLSKMLGDVKFHEHSGIDPGVAESWKQSDRADGLTDFTREMAQRFGYDLITQASQEQQAGAESRGMLKPLRRIPRDVELPLSYAQQRLWFVQQLDPTSAAYNIASAVRLLGRLCPHALQQSLGELARRHDILRTRLATSDGRPVPLIEQPQPQPLPLWDLSRLRPADRQQQARALAAAEGARLFDLEQGPVWRAALVGCGEREQELLLTLHHVAGDGWSMGVMVKEVAWLYGSNREGVESGLEELGVQYVDYAAWQREWLSGEVLEEQLGYWRRQLSGLAGLDLPTDRPRTSADGRQATLQGLALSAGLCEKLSALSRREGVTPFMILLAGFQLLLSRYTGQTDIAIGTPISGRSRAETEPLIGFFINTLVLRTDLSGNPSLRELLRRVRQMALDAYAHQDLPFEKLVEELQPGRDLYRSPFFEILFNYINAPAPAARSTDVTIERVDLTEAESKYPMTLYVRDDGGQIRLQMAYQQDLFSSERIVALLDQYRELLSQIVERPEAAIASYSLITERSRPMLPDPCQPLSEPRYAPVTDMFNTWAVRSPRQVAVTQAGKEWSYEELSRSAQHIAGALLGRGLKPGQVVMVCGEKGFGMIASLLATWLGGGVLLTVDRRLPAARQQAMADVAGVSYLLYVGESRGQDAWMWEGLRFRAIGVDRDTGLIISGPAEAPTEPGPEGADSAQWPQLAPDDPAYIFFTSGTTGGPKGVLGCHKGLSHFLHWQREEFGISPQDRSAQLTGLSFDVVLRDILLPLTSGATLCLPGDDADVGAGRTLAWLGAERVTILHTVPAVAQAWLLNAPPGLRAHSLRKVFFAGEPLTGTLVNDWRQVCANQCEIVNLYGPTETTLAKCYYRVPPDGLPGRQPVGRPMPHTQVLILRGDDQLCGIGEVGEVVIRTPFRTLGYIGGPEEDRRRFVKNMFGDDDQDVLYRTGDLGSYRYDGDIELLGRIDQQVKIRGMRVELAEVEATLAEHPVVRQCAVVVREDERGDNSLAAYVAAAGDRAPSTAELRRYLQARLPEYMVPSAFVAIAELPLTANGKLDRKALPAVSPAVAGGGQGPRTPVEEILAGIWAEVLRRESVGVKENFFDLGGHSLLATQLVSRVREAFQVELPLRALFESPTVEGLAEAVECARHACTRAEAPAILPVSRDRDLPLSYAQQRLWFIHQFAPESAAYNTSRLMRLRGPLNLSALRQGLREIQRRHEVLRTRFVSRDRRPVQVIDRRAEFSLPVWDLSKFEEDEREALARELVRREADRAFDLECGPVWRAALVRLGAEDHMVLLAIHHVASDAWSAGLLANELAALYRAMRAGGRPALPELPIQYADFAVWQRQWLRGEALAQQTAYWKKELEGAPHEVRLPTDRPKPWERSGLGAGCRQVIGPSLLEHVRRFNKQQSVTMFITLLAAFKIVLLKWCRQSDITVGTVIANRNRAETEKLIGCFMNFLPLRTRLGEEVRGIDLLARIKSNVLEAYRHQDCPFEKIVEAINPGRSGSLSPLYNVGFLLLNVPGAEMAGDGIQVEVVTQEVRRALLDVRMVVIERDAELEVLCEYSRDLFEEETIRWLLGSWQKVLEQLTGLPEQAVGSYRLAEELEGATETARSREKAQEIAVAATFTADPVAETVAYWMEELGIGTGVRFAPYNQLHQQLLSEESALSNNRRGVNVALVRLEDWAGPGGGAVRELGRDNLGRSVEEFITAARRLRKRSSVGLAVIICPASPDVKSASGELMTEMERRIEDGLGGEAGVTVVSSREVMRLYPVENYYDAHADGLGHMPYTRAMYAGLGTMIARKAFSFLGEEYKAIALDCDGVLWKGTVGEDGTDGVEIDEGRRRLQEFMVRQQAAGRLLCLCSKNNEADVTEVFARPDMALRLDHLAARRVNWKPKSENLRSLAEELNIGLHQFIFIDDSEIECAEVEARCGDVLVLQLPEDGRRIPTWLDHVWAFDCTKPTDEDAKRTAFYQQNPERERVREEAMTLEDFLRGLALKVDFRPMSEQQVTRVSQLTRRTSQFNNTGIELIEGEIERLIGEQGYSCEVLDVSDRFGEYGLVGAMIYRRQADALRVKTFLLSCRALGRSIEHQMLRRLQERAEAEGAGRVEIEYRETPRNLPARSFLDAVGHRARLDGNTWSYRIKAIPDRDEAASRAAPAMELSGITSAE